jgi:predicted N-acyltransferase
MPLYEKNHSYGEYVFDWAWADAYHRYGLPYYPKLLCAVPFTPATGPRLLASTQEARAKLAHAVVDLARDSGLSSLHVLFPAPGDAQALRACGLLERSGVQFHWRNAGYRDFEDFLGALSTTSARRSGRSARVAAEVTLRRVTGREATPLDWDFFNRCYRKTYREHRSTPYSRGNSSPSWRAACRTTRFS